MGIDVHYQGIPREAELLRLAREDKDVATDMLFPVLLLGNAVKRIAWLREERYAPVRDFCAKYPEVDRWHHDPGTRGHRALPAAIDSSVHPDLQQVELEKTIGYRAVYGHQIFSQEFFSATGFPIRWSPPALVKEFAVYCRSVNRALIPEGLRDELDGLTNFYEMVSSLEDVAVFVMQN